MSRKLQFVHKGFPSSLEIIDARGYNAVAIAEGVLNRSIMKLFTGNLTDFEFLSPKTGNFLVIKGITITGDGNVGKIYLKRSGNGGSIIFPAYFSAQVKGSPSSATNFILDIDEKILISSSDRGTSESFVGLSYIEVNPIDI